MVVRTVMEVNVGNRKEYVDSKAYVAIRHEGYMQGKSDAIKNICRDLTTELDLLNASDMSDVNLYNFAVRIKLMTEQLKEQNNE